jgi:hypothetical protein
MMDNVLKRNICTNVPSSQTFRSYFDIDGDLHLILNNVVLPRTPVSNWILLLGVGSDNKFARISHFLVYSTCFVHTVF